MQPLARRAARAPRRGARGLSLAVPLLVGLAGPAGAGDDRADAEIAGLLDFVAASDCRMVRNGRVHDAGEARDHLARKLAWLRDRGQVSSAEEFIERAASRSSLSGRAYAVRCPDRPEQASGDWLRAELARQRRGAESPPVP